MKNKLTIFLPINNEEPKDLRKLLTTLTKAGKEVQVIISWPKYNVKKYEVLIEQYKGNFVHVFSNEKENKWKLLAILDKVTGMYTTLLDPSINVYNKNQMNKYINSLNEKTPLYYFTMDKPKLIDFSKVKQLLSEQAKIKAEQEMQKKFTSKFYNNATSIIIRSDLIYNYIKYIK